MPVVTNSMNRKQRRGQIISAFTHELDDALDERDCMSFSIKITAAVGRVVAVERSINKLAEENGELSNG